MRKANLVLGVCTALVAFMGFSANAFAAQFKPITPQGTNHKFDPQCEPGGVPRALGLYNASVTTTATTRNTVSDSTGSGLVCYSAIQARLTTFFGQETQFVQLDVDQPIGVEIPDINGKFGTSLDTAYVGGACVRALTWLGSTLLPAFISASNCVPLTLRVDNANIGTRTGNNRMGCPGNTPGNPKVILCIHGVASLNLGQGWVWVTRDSSFRRPPSYRLTIGEFFGAFGTPTGLTRIDSFNQCGYLGTLAGSTCGSVGSQVIFRTGWSSAPTCARGRGIYTLTATQRGTNWPAQPGPKTPPVNVCVPWS